MHFLLKKSPEGLYLAAMKFLCVLMMLAFFEACVLETNLSELHLSESRIAHFELLERLHLAEFPATRAITFTELYLFAELCFATFFELASSALCACTHRSAHQCGG